MLRSTLDASDSPAVRVPSGFPELSHGSSHLRDRSCLAARLNSARDIWPRDRDFWPSRRQRAISRSEAYGSMSRAGRRSDPKCLVAFAPTWRPKRPLLRTRRGFMSGFIVRFIVVRTFCTPSRRRLRQRGRPTRRLRRRRPGSMSWHTSRARTSGLGRDAPVTRRWLPVAAHRHLSSAGAQRAPRRDPSRPSVRGGLSLQPRRPVRLTHRGDGDDPAVAEDDVEPAVVNRDFRDVRPRDASGRKGV